MRFIFLSRKDAKTAKKTLVALLPWRPLWFDRFDRLTVLRPSKGWLTTLSPSKGAFARVKVFCDKKRHQPKFQISLVSSSAPADITCYSVPDRQQGSDRVWPYWQDRTEITPHPRFHPALQIVHQASDPALPSTGALP